MLSTYTIASTRLLLTTLFTSSQVLILQTPGHCAPVHGPGHLNDAWNVFTLSTWPHKCHQGVLSPIFAILHDEHHERAVG